MSEIEPGTIVILNGAPRSGKSSIVAAIQESFDGVWMNLGVDVYVRHVIPPSVRPGIGLRPGGEGHDLRSTADNPIPEPVLRWQTAVHDLWASPSTSGIRSKCFLQDLPKVTANVKLNILG